MALTPSTGWGYYKQLDITDSTDVSADYQLHLVVYSGTGSDSVAESRIYCDVSCSTWPNDIRFGDGTDPATCTELKQWIGYSSNNVASYYVKLPSDGSDTIYMFIGNSSADRYSHSGTWIQTTHWSGDRSSDYTNINVANEQSYYISSTSTSAQRVISKFQFASWDSQSAGCAGLKGFSYETTESLKNSEYNSCIQVNADSDATPPTDADHLRFRISARDNDAAQASSYGVIGVSSNYWYVTELSIRGGYTSGALWANFMNSTSSLWNDSINYGLATGQVSYLVYTNSWGDHWADTGYDSTNDMMSWGPDRVGASEIHIKERWSVVGKYAITPPVWSSYSSWAPLGVSPPSKSHRRFTYYFDDNYGFCFGPCAPAPTPSPPWRVPYDLLIYYGDKGTNDFVSGWCSRWDVQNYSLICETWLKKTALQSLRNNIRPGAVDELYNILGKPRFYDTTWKGYNTIKVKPHPSSNLAKMRSEKVGFVKNVVTHPISNTDWTEIKLEVIISGNQDL